MLYLSPPSTPAVHDAMLAGRYLGAITTPGQGNLLPDSVAWGADNGCFGRNYVGDPAWLEWLDARRYDRARCCWATAPDVVGDAVATLDRSAPFLPTIRALGYPAALVAQNGLTVDATPWGSFDVLFLGGVAECARCRWARPIGDDVEVCRRCTGRLVEWKVGPAARALADEARARGARVHMGRVNSRKRIGYARAIGCSWVDGTFITKGPDRRLPDILRWMAETEREAAAASLFDVWSS